MKTIKKLNLHPGQEIGKVQQQFIMAGSGELVWTGNCFCSKKGHFHVMTASETFEYIDYSQVGVGICAIGCGCVSGETPAGPVFIGYGLGVLLLLSAASNTHLAI